MKTLSFFVSFLFMHYYVLVLMQFLKHCRCFIESKKYENIRLIGLLFFLQGLVEALSLVVLPCQLRSVFVGIHV